MLGVAYPFTVPLALGFASGECGNETWANRLSGAANADSVKQAGTGLGVRFILATSGPDSSAKFTCGTAAGFKAFWARYAASRLTGERPQVLPTILLLRTTLLGSSPPFASGDLSLLGCLFTAVVKAAQLFRRPWPDFSALPCFRNRLWHPAKPHQERDRGAGGARQGAAEHRRQPGRHVRACPAVQRMRARACLALLAARPQSSRAVVHSGVCVYASGKDPLKPRGPSHHSRLS